MRNGARLKRISLIDYRRRCIVAALFTVGLVLTAFAARELWLGLRDDTAAQAEYTNLRELGGDIITALTSPLTYPDEQTVQQTGPAAGDGQEHDGDATMPALPDSLSEINPDFIGWIVIPGTTIDYPVVRGRDNSRYLSVTFSGAANPAGAIFMDYRCTENFDAPVALVYGHNMRNGSMFSPLTNYLNQEFMDNHPQIFILTADGETLIYRIFKARQTDAWDSVYEFDFDGADPGRLLILSTCLDGADRHARLLVFAAPEL